MNNSGVETGMDMGMSVELRVEWRVDGKVQQKAEQRTGKMGRRREWQVTERERGVQSEADNGIELAMQGP